MFRPALVLFPGAGPFPCSFPTPAGLLPRRPSSPTKDTTLVLLPSGEMREYPRPTTATRVLEDASTADAADDGDWFLCDADGMGFEGAVPAVRAMEPLRAGQIYFVLPAAARRKGLRREQVAALAVRASAALSSRAVASAAPGKRRRGAVMYSSAPRPSPSPGADPAGGGSGAAHTTLPRARWQAAAMELRRLDLLSPPVFPILA